MVSIEVTRYQNLRVSRSYTCFKSSFEGHVFEKGGVRRPVARIQSDVSGLYPAKSLFLRPYLVDTYVLAFIIADLFKQSLYQFEVSM